MKPAADLLRHASISITGICAGISAMAPRAPQSKDLAMRSDCDGGTQGDTDYKTAAPEPRKRPRIPGRAERF